MIKQITDVDINRLFANGTKSFYFNLDVLSFKGANWHQLSVLHLLK